MADISVRSFAYRYPRFTVNIAMDFIVEERVILGTCESISENSVYVRFAEEVQAGTAGLVTLYFGAEILRIHATITTTKVFRGNVSPSDGAAERADAATLHFVFNNGGERESVRNLIARLRRHVG